MNERVSDERLEELIAETQRTAAHWRDFDADQTAKNPEYESIVQGKCDDLLAALEELKSLRQASVAGVEAAAGKLTKFVAAKISEWLPGELELDDEDSQAIREFLASLIAERDAKIAELNKHLMDATSKVHDQATAIAVRDAVLGECRYSVKTELELLAPIDGQYRIDELTERLARIDAIVGKEGEGGT